MILRVDHAIMLGAARCADGLKWRTHLDAPAFDPRRQPGDLLVEGLFFKALPWFRSALFLRGRLRLR